MTRSHAQLKDAARDSLAGNYMLYFIVLVITGILTGLANQLVSCLIWPFSGTGVIVLTIVNLVLDFLVMILAKMFQAGQYFLSLNIARGNRVSVSDLFLAFRYDTPKALALCTVLAAAETVCLAPFTICLSGLVYTGAFGVDARAAVSVSVMVVLLLCSLAGMVILEVLIVFPISQALFLYIDHQEYSMSECLSGSRELMRGRISDFFLLHLSLIGYFALSILSLGVGLVWTLPYLNTVRAGYYMDLSGSFKPY